MTQLHTEVAQLRRRVAELEVSEAKYRALFEHANDAIFVTDLETNKYVEVNRKAVEILGYPEQELRSLGPADIASERQLVSASEILEEIQRNGGASFRYIAKRKNGTDVVFQASSTLLQQAGATHMMTIAREVAIDDSGELLTVLLENIPDYIYFKDHSRRFVRASRSFEELLGVQPGEIIGKRDEDVFPAAIAADTIADDRRVIAEGLPVLNKLEGGTISEGVERWVSTTKLPWRRPDGSIGGLYGISKDVTEIKQAQNRLSDSEKRLRQIIDALFGFVGLYTVEGVLIEANRAPLEAAGLEAGDVLGQLFWDTYWWNYDPAVQQRLRDVMARAATGEVVRYEERVRVRDDVLIDLDLSFGPIRAPDGTITGIIGCGVDLTEHKRAALALQENEERLRLALEASGQGTWELDLLTMITTYDAPYAQILGFPPDELRNQDMDAFSDSMHPDDRPATFASFEAYLAGDLPKYEVEFRLRTKSGGWKWILAHGKIVDRDAEGPPLRMLGTHTDITERKRAEEQLSRARETLLRAERLAKLGSWSWNLSTNEFQWSPEMYRLRGMDAAEHPSVTLDLVQSRIHPEDLSPAQERVRRSNETGRLEPTEYRVLRDDGETRVVRSEGEMVTHSDGTQLMYGFTQDITEAHEARHREQLLIQELNHRVKNAMATVVGLASATALAATSVAEFVTRFSRRIEVMAGLHETLAHQNWADVSLESLVQDVALAGDEAVSIAGPAILLSARVAMPLGQALFELNANAARHGALSVPEGRVDIRWESIDDGAFRLRWTESGGPEVTTEPRPGVGLTLLTGLVDHEIGGKIEIDFARDGVCAVVQFPSR